MSYVSGLADGLAVVEGLCGLTVQACMPPKVPVPKPGPCSGDKRGPGNVVKKAVKKATATPKAPRSGTAAKTPKEAKAPPAEPAAPPGVAALPRTPGKPEAPGKAAKNTNPLFGLTGGARQPVYRAQGRAGQSWTPEMGLLSSGAYEENCTNVILAWDMRMRGYDVQAAPMAIIDKHGYAAGRTPEELDQHITDAYRLPDGRPHGRRLFADRGEIVPQPWRSFASMDEEIERDWPEGGRGFMTIGKHVFNVMKVNGKARYIEAQSDEFPSRIVTSAYKKRHRAYAPAYGMPQEGKLMRLDDLVPAEGILRAVETREQGRQYAQKQAQQMREQATTPPIYIEQEIG